MNRKQIIQILNKNVPRNTHIYSLKSSNQEFNIQCKVVFDTECFLTGF